LWHANSQTTLFKSQTFYVIDWFVLLRLALASALRILIAIMPLVQSKDELVKLLSDSSSRDDLLRKIEEFSPTQVRCRLLYCVPLVLIH